MNTPAKFIARVEQDDRGCWLWTGSRLPKGYGNLSWQGRNQLAHRVAYELYVGPIPEGLQIDHLCRVRHCVNPEHLEPVTGSENCRRSPLNPSSLKTHCPKGHPYDEANTRRTKTGARICIACARAANKRWRLEHLEYCRNWQREYQRRRRAAA